MPKASPSYFQRAVSLHRAGDFTNAALAYAQHVAQHPSDKLGHYHLALVLEQSRQTGAAIQSYAKALEIDPYYPEALNNLGILLHREGNLDAARLSYARALAARPGYTDAEYNYATAESNAGNYSEALVHFSRVLERNPQRGDAWNNLGNIFLALRKPIEALQAFQVAASVDPKLPDLEWNASVAQLTLGLMPQAWEQFEHRTRHRHAHIPRWRGEPLAEKRLLVHAEQGIGDTFQFVRYCSQVQDGYMVIECHEDLGGLFNDIALIPFGSRVSDFDYQIPLMSFPHLFQTTLETIPQTVPYIVPDPQLVSHWTERLRKPVHSRSVGVVWSGNPNHHNDRNRSIEPSLLGPLAAVRDTTFYCLQQKPLSQNAPKAYPLQFAEVLDDLTWPDTAAILANLDLVISVDTAVAHLAGGMARPVWTLLPYAPDWRWMLDRTDTPWYPTMRLFRQPRLGDWPSVIEEVARELQQHPMP